MRVLLFTQLRPKHKSKLDLTARRPDCTVGIGCIDFQLFVLVQEQLRQTHSNERWLSNSSGGPP